MTNFPAQIPIIQQLAAHKNKMGYTTAAMRAIMDGYGWQWRDQHIDDLLEGRVKPTADETRFLEIYLMARFYAYNTS